MNRLVFLLFVFIAIGCGGGEDTPDGILPPRKMQQVMWDMIQVDGLVSYSLDSSIKKPEKRIELYSTVLKNYSLSKDDFKKSMQYYQSRPDLLKVVFDSLQQMSLRDTARVVLDTPKIIKDTVKQDRDTIKSDSIKPRKLPIERIKELQKGRIKAVSFMKSPLSGPLV